MRLLFFAGGSYIGGMEIVTMHLMEALRSDGHDARAVISGWNDGAYAKLLQERNIPYYELKLGRIYLRKPSWTIDGLMHWPKAILSLRRLLSEMKPDVIVIPDIELAAIVTLFLPRSTPMILYFHSKLAPVLRSIVKYAVIKRMAGAIAVSKYVRDTASCALADIKTQVVHNGIPIDSCNIRVSSRSVIRLGIIGQVSEGKRLSFMLDVLEVLRNRCDYDYRLVIFGNNRTAYSNRVLLDAERRGLDQFLEWRGFEVDQSKIYSSLDVLVAPALHEAFGMTVVESMARGIPVVVSNAGGFPEVVSDGVTGYLVDPYSPEEMAQRLIELQDDALRKTMGEAGREWVRTKFTSDVMARNFVDACHGLGIESVASRTN